MLTSSDPDLTKLGIHMAMYKLSTKDILSFRMKGMGTIVHMVETFNLGVFSKYMARRGDIVIFTTPSVVHIASVEQVGPSIINNTREDWTIEHFPQIETHEPENRTDDQV